MGLVHGRLRCAYAGPDGASQSGRDSDYRGEFGCRRMRLRWGEALGILGGVKAIGGFALGFGASSITGTQSWQGRTLAGAVGAFGIPGVGYATGLVESVPAKYAIGSFATGVFSSLGEFGGQTGDISAGATGRYNYTDIGAAGLVGAGSYALFGEGIVAAATEAQGTDRPLATGATLATGSGLGASALQPLFEKGFEGLGGGNASDKMPPK